eukprot:4878525-Prymnesium_polylepis.1
MCACRFVVVISGRLHEQAALHAGKLLGEGEAAQLARLLDRVCQHAPSVTTHRRPRGRRVGRAENGACALAARQTRRRAECQFCSHRGRRPARRCRRRARCQST